MTEEVISSGGNIDPTPAGSSAGASSPAVPAYAGSIVSSHGHVSKAASLSCVGSQQPKTSLSTNTNESALGSSRLSCRPWEREDLLRRLATFKPSFWSGKPKVAKSLVCAQRGWMNIDVDKIACESCGTHLSFVLPSSWSISEVEHAGDAFSKRLDTGHSLTCPWRGNSCPETLVQFPPTSHSALIGGFKDRCDGLAQFRSLPVIAASAIEKMKLSRGLQVEQFLARDVDYKADNIPENEVSHDGAFHTYSRAQKLISLCGWEPRWLPSVQDFEEHSAQSARNGCSVGPAQAQILSLQDPWPTKSPVSVSLKKDTGKSKMLVGESKCESRSPLLDCSLCGTSVRILDFITVPRLPRLTPINIDILDTDKKTALTRGVSAASGINGWVATDDVNKEQVEDRDEVTTTNKGKLLQNVEVDLNLTIGGGLSYTQLGRTAMSDNIHDNMGFDLVIGQPSGSEVGDRATSYESRGPSSRKRVLEIGGSSNVRPQLMTHQADSIEGTVIDRDGDEVTGGAQCSAGPSKRVRESDMFDTHCSSYRRDSSGAGPSHSLGFEPYPDTNTISSFRQGNDHLFGFPSARDSTRASSVIAMDTICHSPNENSMESVENFPGNFDDVQFPSSSLYGNLDLNDNSELNYSNQAQQSSINGGEEIFHAEIGIAAQARDGFSFGISGGGSVGMCASYEAEIHGNDASIHRTNSVVGDVEPRIEDGENQGQTGESAAAGLGVMDEISPEETSLSQCGSKFDGSMKDESAESGQKANVSLKTGQGITAHRGHETSSRKELVKDGKASVTKHYLQPEFDFAAANGIGPPKWESNYEEATEFDPISYHHQFCPWVNGNVAAAGCTNSGSTAASVDDSPLCGWQLTLDALDSMRTQIPAVQSESATSLCKDDNHQTLGRKLPRGPSVSKKHGKRPAQP